MVKIRQLGFPIRRLHRDFAARYGMLLSTRIPSTGIGCETLLTEMNIPSNDWKIGKTKVFMRQYVQSELEAGREKRLIHTIIKLQACMLGLGDER